jgi:hypothetical protein
MHHNCRPPPPLHLSIRIIIITLNINLNENGKEFVFQVSFGQEAELLHVDGAK